MYNCPCPTDVVPENPCCPNTTELGSTIEVRDKDCNPRRLLVNGAGVLAARNGKAGMMDGSANQPVTMNFESFFAADGYVLLQSPGGRIIAIKPNEDLAAPNAILQFVYQDGAFKLVPITHENLFSDSDTPSNASGIMAMIACGGPQGLIKLGKFIPFPQTPTGGPFPVVVDSNNVIRASDVAIDECPATDSVSELTTLIGCVDGKWKTILPVKDKTLIGVESAGAVKWALKDGTGALVEVPRTNIFSRHNDIAHWPPSGTDSGTINIASLSGYLPEYRFAYLHLQYWGITQNFGIINNVSIEGRRYIGLGTQNWTFHTENNQTSVIVAIPTSKVWNVTTVTQIYAAGASGAVSGQHHIDISLDGWMK